MQNTNPIAFFDSGLGALPYLAEARKRLPLERFVFLADRKNFPYGTKTDTEVKALAVEAAASFVKFTSSKALVVACNTITEHAIDLIREALPGIPVIGTVPAIKPAAILSKTKKIGVIATQAAVDASYLDELAKDWASDCSLVKVGAGNLVEFVEHKLFCASKEEKLAIIRPFVNKMLEAGCDVIVLGCTHFVHLFDEFLELASEKAMIIDSRNGVISRLVNMLKEPSTKKPVKADEMYLSGDGKFEIEYKNFAKAFGLTEAGTL